MRKLGILVALFCGGCGPLGGILFFMEATDSNNPPPPEPLVVVQSAPETISASNEAAFTFSVNRTDLVFEGRLARIGETPPPFAEITNPLVLSNLDDGEYEFTVRVSAGDKISEAVHRWRVDTTAPDPPTLPVITNATDTEVFLAWIQGADLGSGIVGYEIHYSLDEPPGNDAQPGDFTGTGGVVATLTRDSPARVGNVTLASIGNLERCKRYFVGVSAIDAAGNRSAIAQAPSRRTGCGGNGKFAVAREIAVTPAPVALAAADFDGDGQIDLVTDGLFFGGNGDGTFASRAADIFARERANLTAVDLNGDGAIDTIGGKVPSLNRGDGQFGSDTGPPGALDRHAIGDFNNDGVPDAAFHNNDGGGADDVIRLGIHTSFLVGGVGRGDASFRAGSQGADVADFDDLAAADMNGDGNLDVVLVQDGRLAIHLGDGTLTIDEVGVFLGTGDVPRRVLPFDLNRDGRTDLAVSTGDDPANVRVFLGFGDGTFAPPLVLPAGRRPGVLVAGDFNADAIPDLAVACEGSDDVHIYLGQGADGVPSGTWVRDAIYPVGAGPVDLVAADFNNDGILDLATANETASGFTILEGQGAAGRGNGTLALAPELLLTTGDTPRDLLVADFDGDAVPDIAVLGEPDPALFELDTGQPAPSIVIFRGNGVDGQADGTYESGQVLRLAGIDDTEIGRPGLGGQAEFPARPFSRGFVAADFNNDNALDLAAFKGGTQLSGSERRDLNVFDGALAGLRPTGTFAARRATASQDFSEIGPSGVRTADLNRDGALDLLSLSDLRFLNTIMNPDYVQEHVLSVRFGVGDGTFQPHLRSGPPTSGAQSPVTDHCSNGPAGEVRSRHLALGDFNADGLIDVASVDELCPEIHIWLGDQASPGVGTGTFTEQPVIALAAGAAPSHVLVADVNRDRILDVLVVQQGPGTVRVFLGNGVNGIGDGTFTPGQEIATGAGAVHVSAVDFDNDKNLDLAVANRTAGTVSVLLGTGAGTFTLDRSYPVGTNPIATAPVDANADNVPDLAVADETDRAVRILLGVNELE